VLFVQQGRMQVNVEGQEMELSAGDTFTTPIDSIRSFSNVGTDDCIVYVTRRSDHPEAPEFL
jgi:quercetin dioxygenase-like cupin family protein